MKEFKITEEHIKELAKGNSKVKKWFPEVFEIKLEVGKWYKRPKYGSSIFCITELTEKYVYAYGLTYENKWTDTCEFCDNGELDSFVLATEEEVLKALKNEAIKRGFKKGVYIEDIYNGNDFEIVSSNKFDYEEVPFGKYRGKVSLRDTDGNILFVNGKWAEIIPALTKKEAEKKLNVKIID